MPESLAITGNILLVWLPEFHMVFISAVTFRNFDNNSLSSAAKLAGTEVTSKTRIPRAVFSASP